jgi:dTDP-4-amino-4,6-dideoxygalactose transaminase
MDAVQLFIPTFRIEECLAEIRQCLEKGWTGIGYKTVEFEDAWVEYTGLPCAHFLNSATSGLHLAVRLFKERLGWSDGDEIISTPLTFVSTNHAILYEGMTPVFADVDESMCLDPESVRERITPRTRAIVFVGLGGNSGRLQAITRIAREHDLKLILDAAHMAGTRLHGRHVGHESDVAVFSFQAVKNLPTADSGMICFADQELDAEVRKWTWLGINKDTYTRTASQGAYKWYYDVENTGFKYHGNSVMAALGLVALKYLDQDNAFRRQVAAWYEAQLANVPGIDFVPVAPGCESSRHLFQVAVDRRDEVMASLNAMGIFPGVHYRDNTLYRMYGGDRSCPNARLASGRLMSLPMHMRLRYQDVGRVTSALIEVVRQMNQYHRGVKSA